MHTKYTDTELIEGLRTEDELTLGQMYRSHINIALDLVQKNGGSRDDAYSIYHDSIIALIENIRANKFKEESKLKTYLTSIMKLKWLRELKRRKQHNNINLDNLKTDIAEEALYFVEDDPKHQAIKILTKKMSELNEDCRKILVSFYYQRKKLKDMALEFNYTEGSIRVKKLRCLNSLKDLIKA